MDEQRQSEDEQQYEREEEVCAGEDHERSATRRRTSDCPRLSPDVMSIQAHREGWKQAVR